MAKGERVHDPSAVRGRLSEREGGRERGRKKGKGRGKKRKVARGRSHLLVNKERTGKGKRKRPRK